MAGLDGTITVTCSEYRPCLVGGKKALFHKWVERAELVAPSPLRGGHQGGVVSAVLALIEFETGDVAEVYPNKLRFLDSKGQFSQFCFDGAGPDVPE